MFKVIVFIPLSHVAAVKQGMFDAGAGKIGVYDSCCFETQGTGQFRPLEGSDPFVGKTNEVETVQEVKVEMVCDPKYIEKVVAAMKLMHPYEEVAYDVLKLEAY
ncbi:MAG: NGG1p interacting factor NIF3 [Bacteriovoracaceae bacterium]|nr:NGG1p interacting factor NIF3 [Bacteriovoracaceae bacterium]